MRVLFFDPGAERMGYAVLEANSLSQDRKKNPPVYIDSGITRCERADKESFQEYKLRLEKFWADWTPQLIDKYQLDEIVNEIVPAVGGGNFVIATQSELAKAAITAIHVIAFERNLPVGQIGATTIKKKIAGKSSATKVGVRNGVIKVYPELEKRRVDWIKVFDESDAIAGGTVYLGYENG